MSISAGQFLRELVAWQWISSAFFIGYGWLVVDIVYWYRALDAPTTQQTFLVTTVTGLAPLILNFYMAQMQRIPTKVD